ncbi:MAG: hypothetical protein R3F30_07670 [Planctomycetota bacterium]
MATQIHPADEPRVLSIASTDEGLAEARAAGRRRAARRGRDRRHERLPFRPRPRRRGIPALGLLGEMPFFAAGILNPKARPPCSRSSRA